MSKNKGYHKKTTGKLVGDRYRLNKEQRIILYRGIYCKSTVADRGEKIEFHPTQKHLSIDGYNILFSIYNYLLGKTLFRGNDGFLRDVGDGDADFKNQLILTKAIGLLMTFIKFLQPLSFTIYLDKPLKGSVSHGNMILLEMENHGLTGSVTLVDQVDKTILKDKGMVLVTSDSQIIDKSLHTCTDLLGPIRDLANMKSHPILQRPFLDLSLLPRP